MSNRANLETANDPHPVEQSVSIEVGTSLLTFNVVLPRYVYGKLTQADWMKAATLLRGERDRHVREAVFDGSFFSVAGMQRVRDKVRQSMCDLVYEQFTQAQIAAGEEAWAVPETLQRAS